MDDDSTHLPADADTLDDAAVLDGDVDVLDDDVDVLDDADFLDDDATGIDEADLSELDADGVPVLAPISDPIGTARRRHGAAGAMLAAGMFGADIALGRKPKEEAPVVITASGDPTDIDTDGIEIPIDDERSVFAPPQPPSDPFPPRRPRK